MAPINHRQNCMSMTLHVSGCARTLEHTMCGHIRPIPTLSPHLNSSVDFYIGGCTISNQLLPLHEKVFRRTGIQNMQQHRHPDIHHINNCHNTGFPPCHRKLCLNCTLPAYKASAPEKVAKASKGPLSHSCGCSPPRQGQERVRGGTEESQDHSRIPQRLDQQSVTCPPTARGVCFMKQETMVRSGNAQPRVVHQ
jgi:hypothetical protein